MLAERLDERRVLLTVADSSCNDSGAVLLFFVVLCSSADVYGECLSTGSGPRGWGRCGSWGPCAAQLHPCICKWETGRGSLPFGRSAEKGLEMHLTVWARGLGVLCAFFICAIKLFAVPVLVGALPLACSSLVSTPTTLQSEKSWRRSPQAKTRYPCPAHQLHMYRAKERTLVLAPGSTLPWKGPPCSPWHERPALPLLLWAPCTILYCTH